VTARGSFVLVLLALVAQAGCGPQSDRLAVSGNVTLDGVALDSGSIRFTSLGGQLISSGAMIRGGAFNIPQEKGLLPGKYHLEINSPDEKAAPIIYRSEPGAPGIPTQPERIPAEYNVSSKQTVDVSTASDNHFKFEIVSRPTKQ
jgi:hypothetical protein